MIVTNLDFNTVHSVKKERPPPEAVLGAPSDTLAANALLVPKLEK